MAEIVIPYSPRHLQAKLHNHRERFSVVVCHRRWGKTVWSVNELIKTALTCPLPNPRTAYICPLHKQAKAVAWDYAKHYSRPVPGISINEAELRIDYPNGGRLQLHGADNPDALRGIYLDGAVLDEYSQQDPRAWAEVIRPALSDRHGWAAFIGTPQGANAFKDLYDRAATMQDWRRVVYRASETGILEQSELDAMRAEMSPEEYAQELECSWSAAIRGAYYGRLIDEAEQDGRVRRVPVDTTLPVNTAWDLGMDDSTVIWFYQLAGHDVRVVDHYEAHGEGLAHYAKVLQDKGYVYGKHTAPHDIEVREMGTGKSRKEVAFSLGIRFQVSAAQSVADGIQAVRSILPRCWFDAERCKTGIDALRQYRADYRDKRGVFTSTPLHDWTSHSADAFRYLALGEKRAKASTRPARDYGFGAEDISWKTV